MEIELDPCVSRTVQPRKLAKPCTRPIIAIDPSGTVLTENGARTSFDEYRRQLYFLEPHIVVCYSPDLWLYHLHEYWRNYPHWSWRVAVTNHRGRVLPTKRIAYYGFRDPAKKRNHYHVVLDASSFFRKQDRTAGDLLRLGTDIRAFCNANGLEVRPSAAGIALQLLRHPSFYPFARRRVPHFINEEARPHLPGGFYESYADAGQRFDAALYIDQESAHHYAASSTPLPNANSVRAIGYTRSERPYARNGGTLYNRELQKHGLVKVRARVPALTGNDLRFAPRVMRSPGEKTIYLWSNEIKLLESLGLEIVHIVAVWGTEEVDHGLAKYAQWARDVQHDYPALKALLLMPYGLLARRRSNVTYHVPGGDKTLILANQRLDDTRTYRTLAMPDTANALQLGLIQSFVRSLSLDMARQIAADNHEVISVYADGIFVKLTKGKSVPLFAPWREKGECLVELNESLRVPARTKLKRDYLAMQNK